MYVSHSRRASSCRLSRTQTFRVGATFIGSLVMENGNFLLEVRRSPARNLLPFCYRTRRQRGAEGGGGQHLFHRKPLQEAGQRTGRQTATKRGADS